GQSQVCHLSARRWRHQLLVRAVNSVLLRNPSPLVSADAKLSARASSAAASVLLIWASPFLSRESNVTALDFIAWSLCCLSPLSPATAATDIRAAAINAISLVMIRSSWLLRPEWNAEPQNTVPRPGGACAALIP